MRAALVAVALGGCYTAAPPEGAPCGPDRRCPTGQTCSALDDRCYADPVGPGVDAPATSGDGSVDAPPATACVARRLLTGGVDVASQGWSIERVGTGTVTYSADRTTLTTTNNARQLLVLRNAFPPDRWAVEIVAEVVQSGGHTPNHAAIALMSSFHDPVGDDADRRRMLFLDIDAVGWGEGNITLGQDLTKPTTYRLERNVSGSGNVGIKATITGSGTASLASAPFTSNGTVAIGDQTTEPGLDSSFHVLTVDLLCP